MAPDLQRQTAMLSARRVWIHALILLIVPLSGDAWVIRPTTVVAKVSSTLSPTLTPLCSSASSSPNDEARTLQDQATRLRQEIAELERSQRPTPSASQSSSPVKVEQNQADHDKVLKKTLRHDYEAVVPVLLGDGSVEEEEVEFVPFHKDGLSRIVTMEANLPLGIVLGESEEYEGAVSVDQVAPGSSGDLAGLKVGDLVRAFTASRMQMDQPAWQLLAGGIGIPKHFRFMYSADRRPFEEVMEAIGSNRMDPQGRPVLLVIERMDDA
jgi:hypothetical protein